MYACNKLCAIEYIQLVANGATIYRVIVLTKRKGEIYMKKLKALLLTAVIGLSFIFVNSSSASAAFPSANEPAQVVPTTKRTSRKVYRKGRWVTVTTWKNGKRVTKRVWRKGYWVGGKVAGKTKEIIMGKERQRP